jgi:hypothetical protein
MPAVRRARLPALRRADLVCDTAYMLSLTGLESPLCHPRGLSAASPLPLATRD